jgi:hypothetical protein
VCQPSLSKGVNRVNLSVNLRVNRVNPIFSVARLAAPRTAARRDAFAAMRTRNLTGVRGSVFAEGLVPA